MRPGKWLVSLHEFVHVKIGASVAVECMDGREKLSFDKEVKTNKQGEFTAYLCNEKPSPEASTSWKKTYLPYPEIPPFPPLLQKPPSLHLPLLPAVPYLPTIPNLHPIPNLGTLPSKPTKTLDEETEQPAFYPPFSPRPTTPGVPLPPTNNPLQPPSIPLQPAPPSINLPPNPTIPFPFPPFPFPPGFLGFPGVPPFPPGSSGFPVSPPVLPGSPGFPGSSPSTSLPGSVGFVGAPPVPSKKASP
ncbi:hypothetical protein ACLOJK_038143 [Asimina triloba]